MNDTSPLVSVIIPAYNCENFILESVNSILNQTYKNLEIIILDDSSTDSTYKILTTIVDNRIKLIRNEKNLYIAENRNKGLKLATGKYIVWQDADDISKPNRIAKLVNFMQSHMEVGICGSYLQSFDENGLKDVRKYETTDTLLRKSIFKYSPVAQPTAIIRKSILDKVGYFNPSFPPAEDLDMSFRIGNISQFANIPEVLLLYREHQSSNTSTRMKKQLEATLEIRKSNKHNSNYHFDISDSVAYYLTWSIKFLPADIVIKLFKISRFIARVLFK